MLILDRMVPQCQHAPTMRGRIWLIKFTMSKTPFMPLWVSDFLGDTLDLDAAEIGAYMLLLMAQWNRDGESLPCDDKKLRRVARCGRSWPKVWGSIQRYFDTDENGVYSKRLRLEAQNVAAKRAVNAHNGGLGGKAKALNNNSAPLANATNSPERKATIPEPEPYTHSNECVAELEIPVPAKKRKRPAISLPDDWTPDMDQARELMDEFDLSREDMNFCYQQMKGHANATDRKQVNWNSSFGNWVRKDVREGKIGPKSKQINGRASQSSIWD